MIIGIVILLVILLGIGWIANKVENIPSNRPSTVPLVRHHGAGNADGQTDGNTAQRNDGSSQGDHQTEGSSGSIFWPLVVIVLLLLAFGWVHYNWSYLESRLSADDMTAGPTECADYTVTELDYNRNRAFSPYVVSSEEARGSYPVPPCGANLVYIGGYGCYISSLCIENCQGNSKVEGKTLHFEFYSKDRRQSSFRDDPQDTQGIRPLPNASRVDWVVRHGAIPPSTPAGAEYFFVWLVDAEALTSGTLLMEAKKGCKR